MIKKLIQLIEIVIDHDGFGCPYERTDIKYVPEPPAKDVGKEKENDGRNK